MKMIVGPKYQFNYQADGLETKDRRVIAIGSGTGESMKTKKPIVFVLGFAGHKGAGKDTAARAVIDLIERGLLGSAVTYFVIPFADPLRRAAREITGWTMESMLDPAQKEIVDPEWGVSRRFFLQTMGTDFGRKMIADDLWIRAWKKAVATRVADEEKALDEIRKRRPRILFSRRDPEEQQRLFLILVPDVRFPNELAAVREAGTHFPGSVARIVRPEPKKRGRKVDRHPSETALDDVWLPTWVNDGSKNAFVAMVQEKARMILEAALDPVAGTVARKRVAALLSDDEIKKHGRLIARDAKRKGKERK